MFAIATAFGIESPLARRMALLDFPKSEITFIASIITGSFRTMKIGDCSFLISEIVDDKLLCPESPNTLNPIQRKFLSLKILSMIYPLIKETNGYILIIAIW